MPPVDGSRLPPPSGSRLRNPMLNRLVRSALPGTCLVLALSASSSAQEPARNDSSARAAARGNTLPLIPTRTLKFTTDQGTWLSLDLSRDGRTIVFDLLGDLYTL